MPPINPDMVYEIMDQNEIDRGIELSKVFIKNWDAIAGLNLDFTHIDIEGLVVDKREDENGRSWAYSLLTTMYSKIHNNGRDVYSVQWQFKDLWGNLAFFTLEGPLYSCTLHLEPAYYPDNEGRVIFFFLSNDVVHVMKKDESGHFDYLSEYDTLFRFDEADETAIVSVKWKMHQLWEEDDYPHGISREF